KDRKRSVQTLVSLTVLRLLLRETRGEARGLRREGGPTILVYRTACSRRRVLARLVYGGRNDKGSSQLQQLWNRADIEKPQATPGRATASPESRNPVSGSKPKQCSSDGFVHVFA